MGPGRVDAGVPDGEFAGACAAVWRVVPPLENGAWTVEPLYGLAVGDGGESWGWEGDP